MTKPKEGDTIAPQSLKDFLLKQNAWRTAQHGTPGSQN